MKKKIFLIILFLPLIGLSQQKIKVKIVAINSYYIDSSKVNIITTRDGKEIRKVISYSNPKLEIKQGKRIKVGKKYLFDFYVVDKDILFKDKTVNNPKPHAIMIDDEIILNVNEQFYCTSCIEGLNYIECPR